MKKIVFAFCMVSLSALSACQNDTRSAPPTTAPAPQAPAPAPTFQDERAQLTTGKLYVPARYAPSSSQIDLLIHLHGWDPVVEREFNEAGLKSALVVVNFNGLSSAYKVPFQNPTLFQDIIDEAVIEAGRLRNIPQPQLGRLVLCSFSAGYGGVREILKSSAYVSAIDDLIMSDSLHSGYVNGQPNPSQLSVFVDFANKAAQLNQGKRLIMTHSQIVPGSYASTTETADLLINSVSGQRSPDAGVRINDMDRLSHARVGEFVVYGFAGNDAAAHTKHLQNIGEFMKETSIPR